MWVRTISNAWVSLNRVHIDTAIPFPYNNKNLMFYTGCLVLRPELAIHPSDMLITNSMSKMGVIPQVRVQNGCPPSSVRKKTDFKGSK